MNILNMFSCAPVASLHGLFTSILIDLPGSCSLVFLFTALANCFSFISVGQTVVRTVYQWLSQQYSPEERGSLGSRGCHIVESKSLEGERSGIQANSRPCPESLLLFLPLKWKVQPWRLREGQVFWRSYFEVDSVKSCPDWHSSVIWDQKLGQ